MWNVTDEKKKVGVVIRFVDKSVADSVSHGLVEECFRMTSHEGKDNGMCFD